jgi:hypothetical protein
MYPVVNWDKSCKMVSVADIKKDLPEWPDDVIEQWLHYFANEPDCGWPPPDPLGLHRWNGLLGGKPLSWWRNVRWKKETLTCDLATLTEKARADVSDIIAEMNAGTADASTKRRVAQPWIYIKDNGVFPRALVAMKKADRLSLIDGCHRMAAFEMIQRLTDAQLAEMGSGRPARGQDVWLGTHKGGEVPAG